jgi:hypothetical protein
MAPPEDSLAMAERQVLEGEKYVARQVVPSGFGASCRQVRHWLPEAVSGGGDQVPQRRHALNVDRAPAGERDRLVDVAGRAQEIADLIEGPTEAMDRRELLEAAHRPVASFYSPVILFQHVVFVLTGAVIDVGAEFVGNGLGIAGVSVGGDLLGLDLGDRPGGAGKNSLEEMLLGN